MYRAERYDEVVDIVRGDCIWPYKRWAVRALAAKGHKAEALRYAESCRGPWTSETDVDRLGEEILLSSGLVDEAYGRYGLRANRARTYLATFRAVVKKYPHKDVRQILADLVGTTAGDEAKWFAAAKEAGLFDEALDLARRSPCDPKTLARAARDFAEKQPVSALGAGLLSLPPHKPWSASNSSSVTRDLGVSFRRSWARSSASEGPKLQTVSKTAEIDRALRYRR